jgi:outer membrane receptor protein involved in Fe transport
MVYLSSRRLCIIFGPILAIALAFSSTHAQDRKFSGIVMDETGAVVRGALVSLISTGSTDDRVLSDDLGTFKLSRPIMAGDRLSVRAKGFRTFEVTFDVTSAMRTEMRVVLNPLPVTEQVVVSANRTESILGDTPASVVSLNSQRLAETAAVSLDDALRQVPGFSLFRRSGSRTANPTSQGVSLRGVGASGASRALVFSDGVPLNDPFGGWVYWNRIPRESIDRVEVLRGGASDLYGSAALGGIVNIVTREPSPGAALSFSASGGSQSTVDSSLFASAANSHWSATLGGADVATDGYILVDKNARGPIDTAAGSRDAPISFKVIRSLDGGGRLFAAASSFGESRRNGTPLQINRTHLREFVSGADWSNETVGAFSLRAFGGSQVFDQTFTSVNTARTSETLTRLQRSPSQHFGLSFQWSRGIGERQALVAGVEGRTVRGSSDELAYTVGVPTALVDAGGKEGAVGVFAQDVIQVTRRFSLTIGGRFDRWRDHDAATATSALAANGAHTATRFADRHESAFSPQLAARFKVSENVSLNASIGRAFRAPSLNELYRSFRVGNVLTLANENLRAERSTGGEAGLSITKFNQRFFARGNIFWTEITRPVANVTLSVTPNLITRQRQNLGRTRSTGAEMDVEARLNKYWTLSAGYLFAHATVVEFPANRILVGLWIPQVARQQVTLQARFSKASLGTFALQGRYNGQQFEDDQNLFRLEPYFQLDAFASRTIARRFDVFIAGENLTNQRYSIGRTPIQTIGAPLFVRAGIRFRWGN